MTLDRAIKVAVNAHEGQLDKAGKPYILHPLHLMMQCYNNETRIVAVLHDVIEDSDYDMNYLKYMCEFSDEILNALDCLTHRKGEDYFDYIKRVKQNSTATYVKKLDLQHNSDLSRLKNVTEKDRERVKKYNKAFDILNDSTLLDY